ncbi:hypothetical protein Pcac1_g8860 [Phytophthora cactorum]|nr:hypothetical protein Pcac1_g8860 [Phytophthora cactorum]
MACEVDAAFVDHDDEPDVEHSPRQVMRNYARSCLLTRVTDW